MVINTNTTALVAASNLHQSQSNLARSLARLSSGSKIVEPSDDAAGLAVSSRIDSQVDRTGAARSNVGNAISFIQTQDGYLKKIGKALTRMSELSVLAQDVTKSPSDLGLYDLEYQNLASYITEAAGKDFNGAPLFDGASHDVTTDGDGNTFPMSGVDLTLAAYTDATSSNITNVTNAQDALDKLKAAITKLSEDRATIGAYQARLTHTADQLTITRENLMAASSRIKDVDMAEESTEYAKQNILVQSGTAMLAQANVMPQSVLRLIQQ